MKSPKGRLEFTWMGEDMALTATRLTQLAPDDVPSLRGSNMASMPMRAAWQAPTTPDDAWPAT